MTEWLPALPTLTTAMVVAVVSAWVTSTLALRRFRRDKLWERKVAAYDRIVEALNAMKEVWDFDLDSEVRGRDVPDDVRRTNQQKYSEARLEVGRAINLGAYVLSKDAVSCLTDYLTRLKRPPSNDAIWFEVLADAAAATAQCLEQLTVIAGRELRR